MSPHVSKQDVKSFGLNYSFIGSKTREGWFPFDGMPEAQRSCSVEPAESKLLMPRVD